MYLESTGDFVAHARSLTSHELSALRRRQQEAGAPWWHSPPEEQVRNIIGWNGRFGWGMSEHEFRAIPPPPPRPPGKLTAVVLVVYFASVEETFTRWCEAIVSKLGAYWRLDGLRCDADHLRLLDGRMSPRNVIVWETIDLGANEGESAASVRSPDVSPHAGVLAALALHHHWARVMDGWYRAMYVRLAGYEARRRRTSRMLYVPSVYWSRQTRKLNLGLRAVDEANCHFVVPRFIA